MDVWSLQRFCTIVHIFCTFWIIHLERSQLEGQQCQRSNIMWRFSCRCCEGVTSKTKHMTWPAISNRSRKMTLHPSPKDIILKASAQLLTDRYKYQEAMWQILHLSLHLEPCLFVCFVKWIWIYIHLIDSAEICGSSRSRSPKLDAKKNGTATGSPQLYSNQLPWSEKPQVVWENFLNPTPPVGVMFGT